MKWVPPHGNRATTPDNFSGADAMAKALDDECFGVVAGGGGSVGIPFGGTLFGFPPYDG